jgi:hypothetical protein
MLHALRSDAGLHNQSRPSRTLFAIRWKLGTLFGWDKSDAGLNARVRSLNERLPADLRQPVTGDVA